MKSIIKIFFCLEFWKTKDDKVENRYSNKLKEKMKKNGGILSDVDKDQFENEYGRFRNRSSISAFDLLQIINKGIKKK